jgi:hypothetical protein
LIRALPRAKKRLWLAATRRDFNIGIQSAAKPHAYEFTLEAPTIQAVSYLRARVAITVYAPVGAEDTAPPNNNRQTSDQARGRALARLRQGYDLRGAPSRSRDELYEGRIRAKSR